MKKLVGLAVAAALVVSAPVAPATAAHHPPDAQVTVAKKKKRPFCKTHRCIKNFANGHGTIVQCNDRMWSHSGGRPGVCSGHGGVRH